MNASSLQWEWTISDYEQRQAECDTLIKNLEDWSSIPTINDKPLDNMTDGCLARFQGMVQDVLNPEYFYVRYNVKDKNSGVASGRCGRFLDLLHCAENEEIEMDEGNMKDQDVRHPLFCIPVPGTNAWTKTKTSHPNPVPAPTSAASSSGLKRSLEEDSEMEVDEERKDRPKRTSKADEPSSPSYSCDKYFPLPETGGLACIVKHYGEQEDFLVNTRIEAVGFLSLSPALEASWQDSDAEDKAMHPPPSLVPRLHAIHIRKLQHCNPLLASTPKDEELPVETIRSDLHTALTQLLFGDTLAADYLVCHLLATVYARREGLTLGALSLNLYNVQAFPGYPKLLFEFLQNIVPASAYLPLTIDLLNTAAFVPRKDYETNKLWSGWLQLADDTHLLVDETVMAAGRLGEAGLRNMAALHSLALRQELRYDFTYFQLDFHTNVPVLVLSEGKSIIPTDAALKVVPESGTLATMAETFEAARFFLSGARLDGVRKYLSTLRLRDCDMAGTEFVGPAWADLRQEHGHLKQDDLHRLLVLSRLLALSSGRPNLSRQDWDRAVDMESQRRDRAS